MDIDLDVPAIVAPDTRADAAAGSAPVDAPVVLQAPVVVEQPVVPVAPRVAEAPVAAESPAAPDAPTVGWLAPGGPALLARAPRAIDLADNQLYAAAELVSLGLATRVVIVNAAVDAALPDSWVIRGTPIHLEWLADGRAIVTAGPRT